MGKHLVREVLACNLSKSALKLALMLLEDLSWSMAEMVELLGVTAETVNYARLELQAEQLVSSELVDGRYHFQLGSQQVEEVPQIRVIEAESELVGTEDALSNTNTSNTTTTTGIATTDITVREQKLCQQESSRRRSEILVKSFASDEPLSQNQLGYLIRDAVLLDQWISQFASNKEFGAVTDEELAQIAEMFLPRQRRSEIKTYNGEPVGSIKYFLKKTTEVIKAVRRVKATAPLPRSKPEQVESKADFEKAFEQGVSNAARQDQTHQRSVGE